MEQGFTGAGSANGVSGQNVIRPDENGSHACAGYDATSEGGPASAFKKVDDKAGQIGPDGVGHDHFSGVASGGTSAGPWKQT